MAGRRRTGQPPALLHHKSSGQAFSTLAGKQHYFGKWGTPEALEAYEAFLAVWRTGYGTPVTPKARDSRSIAAAIAEYLADVQPTLSRGEYSNIKRDLDRFALRFGALSPDDIRPLHFRSYRDQGVQDGNHRSTINQRCGRLLRFLSWCVGHDEAFCSAETLAVLRAIPPLPIGKAPESTPVPPAAWNDIVRTLRALPRRLRAMCIVQLHAGPRPGEICRIRGREIFQAGAVTIEGRSFRVPPGVWLFRPGQHKTKKRGKEVIYVLGPKCQAALRPFLRANADEFLFSPAEAEAERKRELRAARLAKKAKIQPSQLDRSKGWPRRKPGQCYTTQSYCRAIHRVCLGHGIVEIVNGKPEPSWNPNQLRHNFVTRMDLASDLVTASAAVGHAGLDTTLIYLEKQIRKVAEVAARVG